MIALILSLLYVISAQTMPVYSRIYLRGMKKLENERIQTDFINRGITYIEHNVFKAAKQGLVSFTTEPFEDCDAYARPFEFDKDVCENIVNGIHRLVSERFPDSEIIYHANTKQYTLKWD